MEGNVFSLKKAMVSYILNLLINEEFPSAQCICRPSGIMRFFSANYALFFGELCAQNPELCANYANCAIFLSEKF